MAQRVVRGIGVGNRRALGPAHVHVTAVPEVRRATVGDPAIETERFDAAVRRVSTVLQETTETLEKKGQTQSAEVLSAQMEFLSDPEYYDAIVNTIQTERIDAQAAISSVRDTIVADFMQLEDEYFRERASDIKDISLRLIADLSGVTLRSLADIDRQVVIVATDLFPSDTMQMNPEYVLAFCTEKGTATSHTALLANSLGIPAIVGCGTLDIEDDDPLIVDSEQGTVHIRPSDSEIADVRAKIAEEDRREQARIAAAQRPAITKDGERHTIYANIASALEAKKAIDYGADGSGLLRTEFFFYGEQTLPTEERQFEIYAEIAAIFGSRPITVRTLDIGGDKPLPALQTVQAEEQNPFLGVRGIRLTDIVPDLLATQLRALIRAATECDAQINIMFPFITTVDEMKRLRSTVDDIHKQMNAERGVNHVRPQVGAMIEIPSAALMITHILRYADFVSIGTNDLTQYSLAADRTNERVSALADYRDPSVLRLIDTVLRAGTQSKKAVSVCGEMAGDPTVIPLLHGMGLSSYSMSAVRIPRAKELIATLRREQCMMLAKRCLAAESTVEVRGHLRDFMSNR